MPDIIGQLSHAPTPWSRFNLRLRYGSAMRRGMIVRTSQQRIAAVLKRGEKSRSISRNSSARLAIHQLRQENARSEVWRVDDGITSSSPSRPPEFEKNTPGEKRRPLHLTNTKLLYITVGSRRLGKKVSRNRRRPVHNQFTGAR